MPRFFVWKYLEYLFAWLNAVSNKAFWLLVLVTIISSVFRQRDIFQTKDMDINTARREPLKRYKDWMPETVSI